MIAALKERLEQSQTALNASLDASDFEQVAVLLGNRADDITALIEYVKKNPEHQPWVSSFLAADREITVRLQAAMDHYRVKLDAAGAARKVHRAYLNEGSRR